MDRRLDVTIKPIYGDQEGAEVGYNPAHAYHTVFLRTLRVALDGEVRLGKEHAAVHGRPTCGPCGNG